MDRSPRIKIWELFTIFPGEIRNLTYRYGKYQICRVVSIPNRRPKVYRPTNRSRLSILSSRDSAKSRTPGLLIILI
jgi:hypothetical protein